MNSTGDRIIDALLSAFHEQVRPVIQRGSPVNLDNSLERAINETIRHFSLKKHNEKTIREHIWSEEELIRDRCRKIILEIEKRERLLDIRKTGVEVMMDDLIKRAPYKICYKIRGNSTVGISVRIPSTRQYMKFSVAYSKIMSAEWRSGLLNDIQAIFSISERLGRIRLSQNESL